MISQVNQGISVYGNKGSTDQHALVFILVLSWVDVIFGLNKFDKLLMQKQLHSATEGRCTQFLCDIH